jgi:uncharacterized protein with HEPN domain
MKKEPRIFIKHIRDCINDIESFSKRLSRKDFKKNNLKQSAIIRKIEVIGEAIKNLPTDFMKKHPSVPWNDIAEMRDKLIHQYFGEDLDKV